jgi:hypothetical protein
MLLGEQFKLFFYAIAYGITVPSNVYCAYYVAPKIIRFQLGVKIPQESKAL